jgi:hypothetical protein
MGFGAAVGLVALGLEVAGVVSVGAASVGCALVAGAVRSSAGEEPLEGKPGTAEQPKARRARQSAAQARRIPRPYVLEGAGLVGHPSVLPDRKTQNLAELVSCREPVIVTPCALQEAFSSYASVSAEQKGSTRRAPSPASRQRGFFVGERTCVVQAYHPQHRSQGWDRQGKETRDV